MNNIKITYILFVLLSLVACGGNDTEDTNDPVNDSDGDGFSKADDCAPQDSGKWVLLSYQSVDLDSDGVKIESNGELCTNGQIPAGYFSSPAANNESDCNDANGNIWQSLTLYEDKDSDGVGTLPSAPVCVGQLPVAGYSTLATDCNDNDSGVWRLASFASRDGDTDGWNINETGQVCAGSNLPQGYFTTPVDASAMDCNDANASVWQSIGLFADTDRDGIGAGGSLNSCVGNSLPAGLSMNGADCDDTNPTIWNAVSYQSIDADGDSVKTELAGELCTNGTLPEGYFTGSLNGEPADCNDADPQIWRNVELYTDNDLDSVGAGSLSTPACIGDTPASGLSVTGTDCDDTNASIWQTVTYQSFDGDSDGHRVTTSGSLCTSGNLPQGYSQLPLGTTPADCDDADSGIWLEIAYGSRDQDQDGIRILQSGTICTNGSLPLGYYTSPWLSGAADCDDADYAIWREVSLYSDGDSDGVGSGTGIPACIGSAVPANESLLGHDCDDSDPLLWRTAMLYQDNDGDGVGSGAGALSCLGESPVAGTSFFGYDPVDDLNTPGSTQIFNSETPAFIYYSGQ